MFEIPKFKVFLRKWGILLSCIAILIIFGLWYFIYIYNVHSFEMVNRSSHKLFNVLLIWPDGSRTPKGIVNIQSTIYAKHRSDRDGATQISFYIIKSSGEKENFHYVADDYMTQNGKTYGNFEINDAILSKPS